VFAIQPPPHQKIWLVEWFSAGAAIFVVLVSVFARMLSVIDEVPAGFPADVLWNFRLASWGIQVVLWGLLGLLFG
jgi:hypothetical protein